MTSVGDMSHQSEILQTWFSAYFGQDRDKGISSNHYENWNIAIAWNSIPL